MNRERTLEYIKTDLERSIERIINSNYTNAAKNTRIKNLNESIEFIDMELERKNTRKMFQIELKKSHIVGILDMMSDMTLSFNCDHRVEIKGKILHISEDLIRMNKKKLYNILGNCEVRVESKDSVVVESFCDAFSV